LSQRLQTLTEAAQQRRTQIDQYTAPIREEEQARTDYYQALRNKYSDYPALKDGDYDFLDAAQTIINNPGFEGDVQLERDRIFAASVYANALNQPMDVAYQNLDVFHEQWTGRKFAKKTGVQAVLDSFGVSFYSQYLNSLAKEYHESGQDPAVLKAMQEVTGKLNKLHDNVPKIWQDEYVKQGGWADIGAFFRSLSTSAGENIIPMGMAIGAGAIASTGVGAIAEALALPAGLTGVLATGASMAAVAETTASQTVGLEYLDLINQGIPDDIAWTNANISTQIQGAIEAVGGGVVSGTTKKIISAATPSIAEKAITKWFIKGKMGAGAKMALDYIQEVAGEAFEEGTQQITSVVFYNRASEQANARRNELLEKIYAEPLEDVRKGLEKELEKHPELAKKEFDEAWKEIREATIGGFGTALLLGIPGARIGYQNNLQSAQTIANIAQAAPNEATFIETINKAKEQGFDLSVLEGMKTDVEKTLLSDIFRVQQERMTPEQREAKKKEAEDATALAEVTDYRNAETVERVDEETGETITELATPDTENIYREEGRLEVAEYTDTNEDGSVNGRFVAGDPRIEDKEQSGANQYGYINYTENENTVTIDDFKMLSGYESIRQQLYDQFAEKFAGKEIVWNPRNEQNIAIRDQLINQNPQGPKAGLNYYEKGEQPNVSNEARQVAERFTPYMTKSTPLEIALAAEAFGAFYRRRGESLNGAMNRLLGSVTNTAPEAVKAAQSEGKFVKGATWLEQTAEGMRRIVYLNKNASDASTVLHETSHAVASDFTDAERRIAARALNGYKLKNGTTVYFDEDGSPWTDEQHEAFAEAMENYFTNGTAPNEHIKGLFERIKEFMKRIYQTMKGWTELSPQVEEFYKKLFSGELVDQARAETGLQAPQEAHSEAQTEKTINDTERVENATTAPQDTARAKTHTATYSHTIEQAKAERDAIINSPDIPLEEKAQAVLDAAGDALFQTDNAVTEQLNRVYEQYHNQDGTAKEGWLKAPNGNDTNLTERQWLMVRTDNFKNWFGDWEMLARAGIYQKGMGYTEAQNKLLSLLETEKPLLRNLKTGEEVLLSKTSIGKLISNTAAGKSIQNGFTREQHYAVASDIENIFYNAEKLFERPDKSNDPNVKIHRYATPLHFGENIALITVKESIQHGKRIYTAELMEIKKLEGILKEAENTAHFPSSSSTYNNLIQKIKSVNPDSVSKIVDKNGEPKLVYHGTHAEFDIFNREKVKLNDAGWSGEGHYFYEDYNEAAQYSMGKDGHIMEVFLNVREPYNLIDEERTELVDRDNREYSIEFSEGLKNDGYDGVFYNGDLRKEWTVFDSNQIKSATDNAGTFDPNNPSILFQLSDEQKETIEAAKAIYGITSDFREAGYLLTDGTMLDLSGKNDGGDPGHRSLDHREMNSFEHKGKVYSPGMDGFMSMGNIRLKPEMGGIELTKSPNNEQAGALRNYIRHNKGDVIIDFSKENLDVENSIEYSGANADRVLNDIKNYYEKGELPPEVPVLFQTAWNGSIAMFDRFDNYYAGKSGFEKTHGWGHSFYSKREAADWFSKKLEEYKGASGWLYEAKIPDDTELIEWEKPLSSQPEKVKNTAVQLITWNKDGKSNFNDAYNLRQFKDGKYGFFRSINGKMKWAAIEEAQTAAKSEIMKALNGKDFYTGIAEIIGEKNTSLLLDSMGIKGIKYLDKTTEKMGLPVSHSYTVFGDQAIAMTPLLFQTEDRNMTEEAASFDSYKEWRSFTETFFEAPMGDYEYEKWTFSEEQIDAWYKTFWDNARKAVNSTDETQETTSEGKATPAELDREFNELIEEPGALEDFVETASAMHNEDGRWGAVDEKDAEAADIIRRKLTHPTWQSIFKAQGKMGQTQRKQLLTMIKNSPREYRAIYAAVMEREDMAVSAEDATAEALKYRITDSRKQDVDSLTPEKLRQLAEDIDVEEFAKKIRTGSAQFNDPIEKIYIKRLQEQIKQGEETLKEISTDRQEDNEYIERIAGKQFLRTFDRVLKAREDITRKNEKLDKAIKTREKDAAKITWQLQRANANYNSIVQTLEALTRAQQLEVNIQEALSEQAIKDYAKSAKTEATLTVALARKAAREELRTHLAELKEKQQKAKEITKAKRGVIKRINRKASPQKVNADQGMAIAVIQRFAEPSMNKGVNEFMGEIEQHDLRPVYEAWKVDEQLRNDLLKDKNRATQNKMRRLFGKEKFEDLTNDEKKYLSRKIAPVDWIEELGLEEISARRNENYPISEAERQIAQQYLPADVYYRIMDKPFSQWTLAEAEELAKIIDDLTVQGKQIYKANIDAEQRRIRAYQVAVRDTLRTVKPGATPEEEEKILNKYDEGMEGTEESAAMRRKLQGKFPKYANMNVYRFARMLDNGDTNGKNSAALYRMARDAQNNELVAKDIRYERMQNRLKALNVKTDELWQKTVTLDLGGKMGNKKFTAWELLGFLMAARNDYSRAAVVGGNMLLESERGDFQIQGITREEITPLDLIAADRFAKVNEAAQKLVAENPNYQKLMDAFDEDFAESGRRSGDALLRYNNTFMDFVKNYFPMHRTEAVSSQTADAKVARDLMGSSAGAFTMFVEKGFTKRRVEIPIQYQTGIKLDLFAVWAEAVEREEHFIAYAQTVKDLNKIYKQSRPVRNAVQLRYGRDAVKYIDKYINELANPDTEKTKNALDGFIKNMRGNAAAAYLSFNVTSIIKQAITSPAPFIAYMNPVEYLGTQIEYVAHREAKLQEITELSPYMKHRSANMMVEMVKEKAKQRVENKADAAISTISGIGMKGLEWIDEICVAPGWMVLFRKEQQRLTKENTNGTMSEKDIKVKAAQYADDIVSITQPSGYAMDIPPLFKGNNELGKAYLQFTQSLSNIWQNVRYDMPQMMRDHRYKNAVGTIIGYTIAGIMLGAITAGFDDDDDEEKKAKKLAWWATLQFTDAFPVIGNEMTYLAEQMITGKPHYTSGANLIPAFQKIKYAAQTGLKGIQQGDFNMMMKAAAQAAEGAAIYKGLPVSGIKTVGRVLGIGDGDGELDFNPGALAGRRR